ncbi:hypothetical protein CNMCM5793_007013 [Aspergillus hiratsukae]|uniref:Uncharacterized protein n=1 Tax=Aspergillus hiratsukae TaxID=1194566 RepID=A0A8H6P515_9EURO|nr:hypothetical protein CNMCM5793_007013 [Aspergillus hiratsukae]KAF7157533.1 hypothetical protein CNMCM6106_003170 [Aspergillus hiratsukae]
MQNGSLWANDSMAALSASEVLSSAYFESMLEKLDPMNSPAHSPVRSTEANGLGFFEGERERSSILLLELQSPVEEAWPDITSRLNMLRAEGYLSYMNGARLVLRRVTVVISSKDPSFMDRTNVTDSDVVFFDTSLESLTKAHQQAQSTTEGYEETDGDNLSSTAQTANHGTKGVLTGNSTTKTVMATADSQTSVGFPRRGQFSSNQIELIRAQVRTAHQHGLLARYTGIQCHPWRLRKLILGVLAQEGVDLIEDDQNDCKRPRWNSLLKGW